MAEECNTGLAKRQEQEMMPVVQGTSSAYLPVSFTLKGRHCPRAAAFEGPAGKTFL